MKHKLLLKISVTMLLILEVLDFSQHFVVETDPSRRVRAFCKEEDQKHFRVKHYHNGPKVVSV
jgi:hypothetical protein